MDKSLRAALQELTARQVITATLLIVAVSVAFWLVYTFHVALILLVIAIFLGTAIRPAVDGLFRKGLPRPWGVLLIFTLFLALVTVVGMLLVPLLVEQSAELAVRLPAIYREYRLQWMGSPSRIIRLVAFQLPPINFLDLAASDVGEINPLDQVSSLVAFTRRSVEGLFSFLALILLTYYWTLESERTLRGLLLWIPSQSRSSLRTLITDIEEKVGGFVRGQAILCLAIALAALAAYTLIGLPNALVLALLAGIFEVVPLVGPILGAIPAVLVALTIDTRLVVVVLIATVLIQALENYVLVPRIMKKAVGVNSIVALLALFTLSSLLGLAGALLAIPVAAVFQLLLDRFLLNRQHDSAESIPGRDYSSKLKYEYQQLRQDIRKVIRKKEADMAEQNDELEEELERLIDQMEAMISPERKLEVSE